MNVVPGSQPGRKVRFQYASESNPGPYPIPKQPRIEAGSDRHLLIVDRGNCKLYELFDARHTTTGWHAGSGVAATDRPDRVVGWHWASPAPVMRLAEIVRTPETSAETIATIEALATLCAKNPIVVNDTPTSWGLARESRVLRDDSRGEPRRRRRHRHSRAGRRLMTDCFRWPAGPFGMVRGTSGGWK